MLLTIVAILLALWLIGVITNVVGAVIHALLVIALIVIVYRFATTRRG